MSQRMIGSHDTRSLTQSSVHQSPNADSSLQNGKKRSEITCLQTPACRGHYAPPACFCSSAFQEVFESLSSDRYTLLIIAAWLMLQSTSISDSTDHHDVSVQHTLTAWHEALPLKQQSTRHSHILATA